MKNRSLKLLLAALAGAAAAVLLITPASAHPWVIRSEPADGSVLGQAPPEVRVWFTEGIEAGFGNVQVLDRDGNAVESTEVRVDPADDTLLVVDLPELEEGVYTVTWRVLSSEDNHIVKGSIAFGLGAGVAVEAAGGALAQAQVSPLEALLRWLNFGLMAAVLGALAVVPLLPKAETLPAATQGSLVQARRRLLGWAVACSSLALVLGLGLLLWQAARVADTSPLDALGRGVWWRVLTDSRFGTLWLAREAILLALTLVVLLLRRGVTVALALAVPLVPALVATQALNSHAAALADKTFLAIAVDALHLLAASVWLGGLLALSWGLLPLLRRHKEDVIALARASWRRFSLLAAVSLALLVATGLYSAGRQVATPDALLTTFYGQALMVKVGLLLGAGGLGLLNAMLLHPGLAAPLARLLRRPQGWTPFPLHRLPVIVLVEATLGVLVLLATGFITSAAPARGPQFETAAATVPSSLSQPADDLLMSLTVGPNKPGENVFTVSVLNTRRPPPAEVEGVSLRFTSLEEDLGVISAEAEQESPGQYRLAGGYLGLAGNWLIQVVARRPGLGESVAQFNWTVPPLAPAVPQRPLLISNRPLRGPLTAAAAVAALLSPLPLAAIWWARRASRLPRLEVPARANLQAPRPWRE